MDQEKITDWFDQTYKKVGFKYLRPLAAYPIFLQLLNTREGAKLLDVACGPGLLLRAALLKGLTPTGVDVSEHAVEIAKKYAEGAEAVLGNAEQLDFPDGTFEFVTCIGALERFLHRERALSEIRRVARDDGRFCFMVRNSETLVWRIWRRALGRQNRQGHQDALNLAQWRSLFEDTGYVVTGVFADQWFRQKVRKLFRGFRTHDYRRPEPVARPVLPLRFANEFIFILRKSTDGIGP